jgi:hypothetical protein
MMGGRGPQNETNCDGSYSVAQCVVLGYEELGTLEGSRILGSVCRKKAITTLLNVYSQHFT